MSELEAAELKELQIFQVAKIKIEEAEIDGLKAW